MLSGSMKRNIARGGYVRDNHPVKAAKASFPLGLAASDLIARIALTGDENLRRKEALKQESDSLTINAL